MARSPHLSGSALRILDASANRAREGLRVLEDHARFALDRGDLTAALREVRHGITAALAATGIEPRALLAARDASADVGARPEGPDRPSEGNLDPVLAAASGRVKEALRTLEETCAASGLPEAGAAMASMRYRVYDLEKQVRLPRQPSLLSVHSPRVYFLWDLDACPGDPLSVLEAALAGGAHWVQLRAKHQPARLTLELGRRARMRTLAHGASLIVNDRADLAQLIGADGIHCGQEDLRASHVRRLLGQDAIVGCTAHSLSDIQTQMTEPVDYVGFGPIAATQTKERALPPLGVATYADLPETLKRVTVPIGGIDATLAAELTSAGAMQVCIGRAIFAASDPEAATREVLDAMRDASSNAAAEPL